MPDIAHERLMAEIEASAARDPRVLAAAQWFANQGWNVDIRYLDPKAEVGNRPGAKQQLDLLSLIHAIIEATP